MTNQENGLLSYYELCELVEQGVISNVTMDMVNASSIDVTLAGTILLENKSIRDKYKYSIVLRDRDQLRMTELHLPFSIRPNEFILASIQQKLTLPNNISAEFKLKSSPARQGLEQLTACWADAGYHGHMTLELKNMTQYHSIVLNEGDRIGQLVFHRHAMVPDDKSYRVRGRYNGDKTVSGIKP